jgi:protein ImuB
VGDGNVGSPQLMDTHRPDAIRIDRFRLGRFRLAREKTGGRGKKSGRSALTDKTASPITKPANGFRFFRPGLPVRVELRDGFPSRIFFQGIRGDVAAASGPWRTSGDWWQEAWDQAEWDVEVHFSGKSQKPARPGPTNMRGHYLLYYDARQRGWFFRGMYD